MANYLPEDVFQRRQMLVDALRNARQIWYRSDLERQALERSLRKAKAGNTKAKIYVTSAPEQMRSQFEARLAQVHTDLEKVQDEIEIYQGELDQLPAEDDGETAE